MIIPWGISAISMIIAYLSYRRTLKKDDVVDTQEEDKRFFSITESLLKAHLKLDSLCTTTSETRMDIKSLSQELHSLEGRVIIVERDLKTAFDRIDDLKEERKG